MTKKEQLFGLCYLTADLLLIPTLVTFSAQLLVPGITAAAQNFCYFLFNFLTVAALFHNYLRSHIKLLTMAPRRILLTGLIGICSYQLMTRFAGSLTLLLYPEFFNVNDSGIADLLQQNFTLMAIGTVFLVPAAEELLYRGLIFGSLLEKSKVLAYIISVTLFAAIHVVPYIGRYEFPLLLACFAQYIPAGISLGWAYQKSGSIFAPILIHTIINAMGIAAMR